MDDRDLLRYSRHILLDEIGYDGQVKLREAHALVIGAGGLGSPASLYLVASGIGALTLVDGDVVDLTNLQRQILHGEADVGNAKATSGVETLKRLNAATTLRAIGERLAFEQLRTLVADADVVLDCSDNFATRHAVNAACLEAGKPLVSGAALQFDGQLTTFDFRPDADGRNESPCYACLFPPNDGAEDINCATQGVFAPLTGIVGTMQAAEAAKVVMGLPTLRGKFLVMNAVDFAWHAIKLIRDPGCPVCGTTTRDDGASVVQVGRCEAA